MELYKLTATKLAKMLRKKECSAFELATSVFSRIENIESDIEAYITVTKEQGLEKANAIDKKIKNGEKLSPLAGIPIGIKDNICTKGMLTTCASKMLNNFVPPYNASVIDKLDECVITGKLNMDEFAMGSSCENSYFKQTKNPHNLEYVPGGSSGGSAAAVAAYEAVISLGSDTGGSIRLPASYCGVVGLKPTYGVVSRYGLVAFASSLDQIGPFGRCVNDVRLLFNAISGKDNMDATSFANVQKPVKDIKNVVIGIPKEYFGDGVTSEVKMKVMDAVKVLEAQGATVKEISLESTAYALSAYYIISSAEASSNLSRFDGVKYGYRSKNYENLTEMYENTRSEGFGDEVKRRILLGTFVLSSGYYDAYYKRAKLLQIKIADEFNKAFNECDVIITPTGTDTAFKLGEKKTDPIKMYANDICTVTVNIAGLPAVSVPCGVALNNMPIGFQIIGNKLCEEQILYIAEQYEQSQE